MCKHFNMVKLNLICVIMDHIYNSPASPFPTGLSNKLHSYLPPISLDVKLISLHGLNLVC
jgi:hypothetical protein